MTAVSRLNCGPSLLEARARTEAVVDPPNQKQRGVEGFANDGAVMGMIVEVFKELWSGSRLLSIETCHAVP